MASRGNGRDTTVPADPLVAVKHIVMWDVAGEDLESRLANITLIKSRFEGLRGRIPGLLSIEVGIDTSQIDYACDVVLYSEFENEEALADYAHHPAHLAIRDEIAGLRTARHQVDYRV